MEQYHKAWLAAHPERDEAWLKERLKDGFHVHHVDGDHSNNEAGNLILVDGVDHLHLHNGRLVDGIKNWRRLVSKKGREAQARNRREPAKRVRMYTRKKVKFDPKPSEMTDEMRNTARAILDAGGNLNQAIAAVADRTTMSWRDLQKAIRREIIAA